MPSNRRKKRNVLEKSLGNDSISNRGGIEMDVGGSEVDEEISKVSDTFSLLSIENSTQDGEEEYDETGELISKTESVEIQPKKSPTMTKRELIKLKKDKQKGRLTKDQEEKYGHLLEVKKSVQGRTADGSGNSKSDQTSEQDSALKEFVQKINEDSKTKDIIFESITISYKSKILLQEADLKLQSGRKFGLIGPNGAGKTTLLRHISQRVLPIPKSIRIFHVEQEAEASDVSALDYVISSDKHRLELFEEEERLKKISRENTDEGIKALERLPEVYAELNAISAYNASARASAILSGLQFSEKMKIKSTKDFSGGWRMRIALACALFMKLDLLILDEPTNHLDLNAVIWLENYLKMWKGTLLVVSHDRDFLNYFVTDIIHLNKMKLDYYHGNYNSFENTALIRKQAKKKEIKKLEKTIKVNQAKGNKSQTEVVNKVKSSKKEYEYKVHFEFDDPGFLNHPIIQIKDMSFTYNKENDSQEEYLFSNVERSIRLESRIAIVGPNGAGKSTFMNLVLGELEPTKGEIIINRKLRTIKFAQHFVEELENCGSAIEYLKQKHPDLQDHDLRRVLGRFGLTGVTHTTSINLLSGGQKSRVMFTNIALVNPHIMFLDEPTNHLDIQSVDALIEALEAFKGGIVLISHDQRLLTRVCNEFWVIDGDQKVKIFDDTFEAYRQSIIDSMDYSLFEERDKIEEESAIEREKKRDAKKKNVL